MYVRGEEEGLFYFAMELVRGPSLADCVRYIPEWNLEELSSRSSELVTASSRRYAGDLTVTLLETGPVGGHPAAQVGPPTSPSARPQTPMLSEAETAELRRRRGLLDLEYFRAIARIGVEAAEALGHAHRQGVLHCDIKPHNLLLSEGGRLLVTDFGLALLLEKPLLRVLGGFFGTLAYASPEQLTAGQLPLDELNRRVLSRRHPV